MLLFFFEISPMLLEGSNYEVKEEKVLEGRKSGDSGRKDKNSEIRGPWVVENYMVPNGSALESERTFTQYFHRDITESTAFPSLKRPSGLEQQNSW